MSYYKIGFHTGPGGNRDGIGEHWRALDSAGIPAIHISVDEAGTCYELDRLAKASDVPHVNVYRICDKIPGFNADVPDYALEPKRAAEIWAGAILHYIPPELEEGLRNGRIWLIAGNEVDKNRASWLGYWAKEVCLIMNPLGYKIAAFGWAAGEPEYDNWTEPGMAEYLRYCDRNPDHAGLAVHEYSYTMNLADGAGYLVGRFERIEEACDELDIHTPNIFITEFGWTYEDVPSPSDCMAQMDPIANLYADHPAVQGAMLWYLGPGFGNISNQVQRLIGPVTEESLRWGYTSPTEPPVEPPEEDFVDFAEYFAPEGGVSHGPIYMIYNNWGQGPERTHLARSPMNSARHFYVTKNDRWERRYVGDDWIWLQADTSRANNEFYTVDGDPWLPRRMKIGDSFTRREQTEIYHLDSCNHINSGGMTSDIKLIGYDTSFQDMVGDRPVIKMAWIIDGVVEEYYWYCRHVGLVGWSNKRGYASRIREFVPTNEQPNPVSWRCSVLNEKPPTNIPEPPEPPEPPTNPILIQGWDTTVEMQVTGIDGIRLNSAAAIQQVIQQDSVREDLYLQVVTSEVTIDGYVFQAAESLTGACPRRVYVWQPGEDVYWFDDPHSK